mmetsp:Transcript_34399/g.60193  ORF Transcript_34399/g.60193 Transcript_34399/m.60193 type:complete len:82 (-) Transcript_34399:314-559(-)
MRRSRAHQATTLSEAHLMKASRVSSTSSHAETSTSSRTGSSTSSTDVGTSASASNADEDILDWLWLSDASQIAGSQVYDVN